MFFTGRNISKEFDFTILKRSRGYNAGLSAQIKGERSGKLRIALVKDCLPGLRFEHSTPYVHRKVFK